MKFLLAPDKFKGSLTAVEACAHLAAGLAGRGEARACPLADGGEGFVATMAAALGGSRQTAWVADPLGRPGAAEWALCGNMAVLEMAQASGLALLKAAERDPLRANTYGTGALLRAALECGAQRVLIGIGGSATNDGGCGLALALGYHFLDAHGQPITDLPARLLEVVRILAPEPFPIPVAVACDVENPLLGPSGATRIYGPQKGILPAELAAHETRLGHLVQLVNAAGLGPAGAAELSGSGAAGGLGYGLRVFAGAVLRPGFPLVAEALWLEEQIRWADVVLTGEGRLDDSSLAGKVPIGLARLARAQGKEVIAYCGTCALTQPQAWQPYFHQIIPLHQPGRLLADSLRDAGAMLENAAKNTKFINEG